MYGVVMIIMGNLHARGGGILTGGLSVLVHRSLSLEI